MPTPSLPELLNRWRILTHRESRAIASASWQHLLELQSLKLSLQPEILHASLPSASQPDATVSTRITFQELISLEQSNQQMLNSQRASAELARSTFEQSCRNTLRLHQKYASAQPPAWQRYS